MKKILIITILLFFGYIYAQNKIDINSPLILKDQSLVNPNDNRGCEDGYVEDCSGDGDCCPETWIGDGYADCEDQAYECDLTCYDNDGGDCDQAGGCASNEFDCGDGTCTFDAWVCDGWVDCDDGSDEADCGEECGGIQTGDANGDYEWNILDITTIASCILQGNCNSIEFACALDTNGNDEINVIDIVVLVDCILQGNCNELPD